MTEHKGTKYSAGKLWKMVRAVLFCAVLAVMLLGTYRLLERKDGRVRVEPFAKEKSDIDVLFFGTSHVVDGIYPMELWKNYGIASYNLGFNQCTMPTAYWLLKEALLYQHPKLIMVDCSRIRMQLKTSQDFPMTQVSFDGFPLSRTKIAAADDLLDDPLLEKMLSDGRVTREDAKTRKKDLFLFNLPLYHSRWKELEKNDFEPDINVGKGAQYMVGYSEPEFSDTIDESEVYEENGVGYDYLREIAALCDEQGIELVLTYLPFPADEHQQKEANTAKLLADELGVPYLNFLRMDVVNYNTDCFDGVSHLNPSGARKVSDYLGRYLAETYGIADHRGEAAYDHWNDDYEAYAAYKRDELAETIGMYPYMAQLALEDYDIVIEAARADYFERNLMQEFFSNMGVTGDPVTAKTDYIIIKGGKSAVLTGAAGEDGTYETEAGVFKITHTENGCERYLDDRLISDKEELDADRRYVRFTVMDPESGDVIDEVEFHYSTKSQKSTEAVRDEEAA